VAQWVVAGLQIEPPFKGLSIRDARLCFDPGAPRRGRFSEDLGVPCPKVALDAERDLGSPPQSRVHSSTQSLEQGELRPVADRIASGVCAQGELETHDGKPCAELRNGRVVHQTTFETPEPAVGGPGSRRGLTQAQPSAHSSLTMLDSEPKERLACARAPTIDGPLSGTHGWDSAAERFAPG